VTGRGKTERPRPPLDEVFGGRKLVFSTTSFIKDPLPEALERIAEGGFRNVEVWGNNKHLDPRNGDLDLEEVERTRRRLGLSVISVHAPFTVGKFTDPPAGRMREWEKLVLETMGRAEYLGARHLVVHPFTAGRDTSDERYRSMVERTEASLFRLADSAASRGFSLSIENMPAHRSRRYGRDCGELYDFIGRSGRANLGLCLDTGHVIFNNGDAVGELERCLDRVSSVHLNDNIAYMHMDLHLVPGTGGLDLDRLSAVLRSDGFNGMIVLELDSRGRPSSIFTEAKAFVRRFFLGLGEESSGRRDHSASGRAQNE
jgi:sugar phosphate isomerase/epimerase